MTKHPSRREALVRVAGSAAALGLVAAGVTAQPSAAPPGAGAEVPLGGMLPDVTMRGLNGPDRSLAAFRGRPLLINVWASWCGPCRDESASLERLAWLPTKEPFAIIGVSTDDYRDRALGWLKASHATLSHFIDQQLRLETLLGARKIPLTVLVDAGGRVVDRVYGAKAWDSTESQARIRRAFAAPRPPR